MYMLLLPTVFQQTKAPFTYYVIIVLILGPFTVVHTVCFSHLVNLCLAASQSHQLWRKF